MLMYNQLTIFDFLELQKYTTRKPKITIEEFDQRFKIGSRFIQSDPYGLGFKYSPPSVLEITDILPGEQNAQIKNISLEEKKKYVGSRYYINKESFGVWYKEIEGGQYGSI